jgi:hypothetical protein
MALRGWLEGLAPLVFGRMSSWMASGDTGLAGTVPRANRLQIRNRAGDTVNVAAVIVHSQRSVMVNSNFGRNGVLCYSFSFAENQILSKITLKK